MEVYRQVFGMQEDVPVKWLCYSFFFWRAKLLPSEWAVQGV